MAHFRELPAPCRPTVDIVLNKLREAGIDGVVMMGKPNETVCEIPVSFNKIGIILQSGLNPVAATVEAGIEVTNRSLSGLIDYGKLKRFRELFL